MVIPEPLYRSAKSEFRTSQKRDRVFYIYDRISFLSLNDHKSIGLDKHDDLASINSKVYARLFNSSTSRIAEDLHYLLFEGFIETDNEYSPGIKSKWYAPTLKALESKQIELLYHCVHNEKNTLKNDIEKSIIQNLKQLKLKSNFFNLFFKELANYGYRNNKETRNNNHISVQPVKPTKIINIDGNIKPICSHLPTLPCFPCLVFPLFITSLENFWVKKILSGISFLQPIIKNTNAQLRTTGYFGSKKTIRKPSLVEAELLDKLHGYSSLLYGLRSSYNFLHNNWDYSRSEKNKRLRHNIVEMPRELRKFLFHPEFTIVDVDLANSQPAILVGVMLKNGVTVEPSLVLAVKNGTYYKTLQKKAKLNLSYSDLKKECLSFLYSQASTNKMESKKEGIAKAFLELWPVAFNWIVEHKAFLNEPKLMDNTKQKGSSLFAIQMQRAESKWMIDTVLPRLFHHNKSVWAVSMHDGCLVDKKHSERLRTIMVEEFKKMFVFLPTVRIKQSQNEF